ncbi:hypothetical protein GW17_00061667, partial [Ensete ventricosum]
CEAKRKKRDSSIVIVPTVTDPTDRGSQSWCNHNAQLERCEKPPTNELHLHPTPRDPGPAERSSRLRIGMGRTPSVAPPSYQKSNIDLYHNTSGSRCWKHMTEAPTQWSMSDAIMCRAFPMTLCGITRGWYNRLPPTSIHSFYHLAREFEANFLASVQLKPTIAYLLGMRQKEDEPLGPYLARFTKEIRVIPDAHPSLVI